MWGGVWGHGLSRGSRAPSAASAANTMFDIEWRGRRVALRASNGRYVCTKRNGQLAAVSDAVGKCRGRAECGGCPRVIPPQPGVLRAGVPPRGG